ncbi:hypothetical protein BH11ACT8_BH11ACT8_34810 [soil metagenome]
MHMDGIRVNHSALEQGVSDMVAACTKIEQRLDRLEADIAPLKSDWVGGQQESYRIAKQKWDTAISEMHALLEQTHRAVHDSNTSYIDADKRGAAQFEF